MTTKQLITSLFTHLTEDELSALYHTALVLLRARKGSNFVPTVRAIEQLTKLTLNTSSRED